MEPLGRMLRRVVNPVSTGLTLWWLGSSRRLVPRPSTAAPQAGTSVGGIATFSSLASPGTWTVPAGRRPGWEWLPEHGAIPNLRTMPRWARVWFRTPFLDRYAYEWMWWHGGWAVLVPADPPPPPDGGVREPRRPLPVEPSGAVHRDLPPSGVSQ